MIIQCLLLRATHKDVLSSTAWAVVIPYQFLKNVEYKTEKNLAKTFHK